MSKALKKPTLKQMIEYLLIIAILLSMLVMALTTHKREYSYKAYDTSTLHYVRGTVTEVVDQNITYSGADGEYITGVQNIKVKINEGDLKDETVDIDNYITVQHNVVVNKGMRVIICADTPQNADPYFTLYNYDRAIPVWILVAIFVLLVVIVGEKKGLMSCIGLCFTMCTVICWLLPSLYNGNNGILVSIITVILSTAVTCFCISGLSRKTVLNIISACIGTVSAGIIYKLFAFVLNISGASMNEAESLALISQSTGLNLSGVLFAGVVISALGAVMDVAVSIGASLYEIRELNPQITSKELFKSGMNIGRDMIGTMTNTLILAFAGGSVAMLILLVSYGVQYNQLISSNYIALEVAKGLAGSVAVVLTVPISAFVCAFGYVKLKIKNTVDFKEEAL
ncbi:MAG: YibE/F family protein [Ruminococcaceae bacterium]|nr:YibE/F family protein [Oscillospiraceae bacterium]